MSKFKTFDIETRSCSIERVKEVMPPFNPDDVKLGNLKDQKKIDVKVAKAEEAYYPAMQEKSALYGSLGSICCITYCSEEDGPKVDGVEEGGRTEIEVLEDFLRRVNMLLKLEHINWFNSLSLSESDGRGGGNKCSVVKEFHCFLE